MRVWVYPEKNYEELGAERYEVSWEEVSKAARYKLDANEDIDPDLDIDYLYRSFRGADAKAKAMAYAYKTVGSGKTAYGCASVTRQVVDWYVEEDRVAEWADTPETESIDYMEAERILKANKITKVTENKS